LNGNKTISEDLSDHSGLRAAYLANQKYGKSSNLDEHGEFTSEQQFFIGYAWVSQSSSDFLKQHLQALCTNATKTDKIEQILSIDEHSLNEHRVNVAVRNMPEFSKAFNCPYDSPMMCKKQCKIW
jgi:putative endopeptidase